MKIRQLIRLITLTFYLALLAGCAHKPSDPSVDPYETFNRAVFAFNEDIDHLIYRPAAVLYQAIVPPPFQKGIGNFFDNIQILTTLPNDLLQGKTQFVVLDVWRFIINSTLGIAGLFDVAQHLGLPKHYNDFGMTLAYWSGKKQSPYLMIPFLGPSTFRDAFSLPFDYYMSPYPYIDSTSTRWIFLGVNYLNLRAQLLQTDKLIQESFDPYLFVRSAYLQHRHAIVTKNMKNENRIDTPEIGDS